MINRKDQVTSCGATYVSRTDTFPDIRTVIQESSMKVNENGIWRIKTNQELDKIIKRKNTINFIRAQRLRMAWSHWKDARNKNGQSNIKKTNRNTKDTLGG